MERDWQKGQAVIFLFVLALLTFCTACVSPEAQRRRAGGPGADTGNRDAVVDMHGRVQPYYQTPSVGEFSK